MMIKMKLVSQFNFDDIPNNIKTLAANRDLAILLTLLRSDRTFELFYFAEMLLRAIS